MPIAVTDAPYRPVPLDPPRKRWTRAEYEALAGIGLLEGRKYQLVEGELIDKTRKKRGPTISLTLLRIRIDRVFGPQFVDSETPIDVAPEDNPASEPEPDITQRSDSISRKKPVCTPAPASLSTGFWTSPNTA
jgi:hypothetical protein